VFCAEEPFWAALFPEFESEKSNCWSRVNQALASELAMELFLKALAFTNVVATRVNGPLYNVEDWVGAAPLVV
jgi:hypothetical protein